MRTGIFFTGLGSICTARELNLLAGNADDIQFLSLAELKLVQKAGLEHFLPGTEGSIENAVRILNTTGPLLANPEHARSAALFLLEQNRDQVDQVLRHTPAWTTRSATALDVFLASHL
ncbi:hypothetical protein [Deinococcus soli (ex Cha et al. 2016)]|uniref:Uncharacterized protein n=2 Tax=Deinococcus soli (ex Cha et al. 2016) TaxID=1309411 RepID=A0ACC6KGL7_9DEIO|nr:hypothetical protein [Deinococcus soli (ex Cha et al. 2016)]MDR6219014.1 hypothetical protein [Deinococcus soli (ex Cha et al. 2016)]MDR6328811.1 hypothetical protein [Deinococcus soli (ex Cha et al. 2016)]MDR6751702.1 hypothetical protein [Deinococcus soli (ex Cha et al. 2016)]